jgi:hypothetical protein
MFARFCARFPIGMALHAAGLLALLTANSTFAQTATPGTPPAASDRPGTAPAPSPSPSSTTPAAEEQLPTIDVLEGLRSGQLAATAEGTGDGRMTLHLTNRTSRRLRVVLRPD